MYKATKGFFWVILGATVSLGLAGTAYAVDCNDNGVLDECDIDCGLPNCNVPGCGASEDCNDDGVPDECTVIKVPCTSPPCDPLTECIVDLILIFDTSGSMDTPGPLVYRRMISARDSVVNALGEEMGVTFNVEVLKIVDIGGNWAGVTWDGTVSDDYDTDPPSNSAGGIGISNENWAAAVAIVSEQRNWTLGARRIIVVVSDEGPRTGDPIDTNDQYVITEAAAIAAANSVVVFPVQFDPSNTPLIELAQELANDSAPDGMVLFGNDDDFIDDMTTAVIVADRCEFDCNTNGIFDSCDIANGYSQDCNGNGVPDECEFVDCNGNGILDSCDIASGYSTDCNTNGIPDDCEFIDCNGNTVVDSCDILSGYSDDCNQNGIPDECELLTGDCNNNSVLDVCEWLDRNNNNILDGCETFIFKVIELEGLGGNVNKATCISSELSNVILIGGQSKTVGGETHAVTWEREWTVQSEVEGDWYRRDLGTLGGNYGSVNDVHNYGDVTGSSKVANGVFKAFTKSGSSIVQVLPGALPEEPSYGSGINSIGTVVGTYTRYQGDRHAFICEPDGTYGFLDPPHSTSSSGSAINELGQVAGTFRTEWWDQPAQEAGESHVFLWNDGVFTDLNHYAAGGADWASAYDINLMGEVAGSVEGGSCQETACVFAGTELILMDPLEELECSKTEGVNDYRFVVGNSDNGPFFWHGGTLHDINDLLECDSGWVITGLYDIDNDNHIVGVGTYQGQQHAVLLTPVPMCDCNDNGVPDEDDIYNGSSRDENCNGIPDECEDYEIVAVNLLDTCDTVNQGRMALNNRGQVVGTAWTDTGFEYAFLWANGEIIGLAYPFVSGEPQSWAQDINDSGQILGLATIDGRVREVIVWENGIPNHIQIRGVADSVGYGTEVYGITDSGYIIGASHHQALPNGFGFVKQLGNQSTTYLEDLDGTIPTAINESLQVGGYIRSSSAEQPFMWENSVMSGLGTLPYSPARLRVTDINNPGQIIGHTLSFSGYGTGVFWENGVAIEFDPNIQRAEAINDKGQVVGRASFGAALWESGVRLDLNDRIGNDSNWDLQYAYDINNHGQIVGWGYLNGERTAFLMTLPGTTDCDNDGITDACELAAQTEVDHDHNGIPDSCEAYYLFRGTDFDCNANGVVDADDVSGGASLDCNNNGLPDECESDCNGNGVPDSCDITGGTSTDIDSNSIPDECQTDCNGNSVPDTHDLVIGNSQDCNGNFIPDECDIVSGTSADCNSNGIPDECDIASGSSVDTNNNGIPDECEDAPPVITRANSVKSHISLARVYPAGINHGSVECRNGGITTVNITFDKGTKAIDGSNLSSSDFTLSQGTISLVRAPIQWGPTQPGTIMLGINNADLTGDFTISFSAENSIGIEKDYELCWTVLLGDVNGDGFVDALDESSVASYDGEDASADGGYAARADIDLDNLVEGGVSGDDRIIIGSMNPSSTTLCSE